MTTSEIIASVQTLHDVVESARQQTEKAGRNPSWLLMARGAFAKAIEQLNLHAQNNEVPPSRTSAGVKPGTAGATGGTPVAATGTVAVPEQHQPVRVAGETADPRAATK